MQRVSYFIRLFLWFLFWLSLSLVGLVLTLIVAFQIPSVQQYAAQKAVEYLSEQYDNKIELEGLSLTLTGKIRLDGLYLEDRQEEVLWQSDRITIRISPEVLMTRHIRITDVGIHNAHSFIYREDETENFNYAFLLGEEEEADDFTEEETNNEDDGWNFSLKRVQLSDINFTFNDPLEGLFFTSSLGNLETNLQDSDFSSLELDFGQVELGDVKAHFNDYHTPIQQVTDEEGGTMPKINLEGLRVHNIKLTHNDFASAMGLDYKIEEAIVRPEKIALSPLSLEFKESELTNPYFGYRQWEMAPFPRKPEAFSPSPKQGEATDEEIPIALSLEDFTMKSGHFTLNDYRQEQAPPGEIDYARMDVYDINMAVQDINWEWNHATATVEHMEAREKSGFELEHISTEASMTPQKTEFQNLTARTPRSEVGPYIAISHDGLSTYVDDWENLVYHGELENSHADLEDVFYFASFLRDDPFMDHLGGKTIHAEGTVTGPMQDLHFEDVTAETGMMTTIEGSGNLQGLPDLEDPYFDFSNFRISSAAIDMPYLFPGEFRPDEIVFPAIFKVSGNYRGSFTDFETYMSLQSTDGLADAYLEMGFDEQTEETSYKGHLETYNLNTGRLARMEEMIGEASFGLTFDGKGLEPENLQGDLRGAVYSVELMDYDYHNLDVELNYADYSANGSLAMDDPNLQFDLAGIGSYEDIPLVNAEMDLQKLHLEPLGLATEDQRIRGVINAEMEGDHVDNLHGDVVMSDFEFISPTISYPVEEATFKADTREAEKQYSFESGFANALFIGNMALSELPEVLAQHLNQYFEVPGYEEVETEKAEQSFSFSLEMTESLLLTEFFLPDLEAETPINVWGNYQSSDLDLRLDGFAPRISYAGNELDSIAIHASSNRKKFDFDLLLGEYRFEPLMVSGIEVSGKLEDDTITHSFTLRDNLNTPKYQIGAQATMVDDQLKASFLEDEFTLNYESWNVDPENYVLAGFESLWVDNLSLDGKRGKINLQSKETDDQEHETLSVDIKDLDILYLLELFEMEEAYRGRLSLDSRLINPMDLQGFTVEGSLNEVVLSGHKAGDFNVAAIQDDLESTLDFDLEYLSRQETRANITGTYEPDYPEGIWEVQLTSEDIFLEEFKGLLEPGITRFKGRMAADASFSGPLTDPNFDGHIEFKNTGFSTPYTKAYWTLEEDRISFDNKEVKFGGFSLKDSLNNKTTARGQISIEDLYDPRFNLDIKADNFTLLNTRREDNRYFYGSAYLDSDVQIRGSVWEPELSGSVSLVNGTNLNTELPEFDPQAIGYEGIVEFVDWQRLEDEPGLEIERPQVRTFFRGVDADLIINIDRQTRLTVTIDPTTGDHLRLQGGGSVNAGIDPAGNLTLAGEYVIQGGGYQMTFYDVVRRRFDIRSGSSITWTGDPYDARVDISAIYTQRTSPEGLFPEQTATTYRQPVPIQVFLNMQGTLFEPDISFRLDMPEEAQRAGDGAVYSRIQQVNENESERNKQVFALLVLNRFLPENPMEATAGGAGVAAGARSSASRILTQQLNELSGRYIRGVDLSFDLESYEGLGEEGAAGRTELQMEVSRRFLEERLEVRVGGQVDLEGERRRESDLSDFAGDVSMEYHLTQDGALRLKGFRQNRYESILDGDYVETGISLRFGRDFNNYHQILRRNRPQEDEDEEDNEEIE